MTTDSNDPLFFSLDSAGIAKLIRTAKRSVFFAGPGIQVEPARAIVEVAKRLDPKMIILCIDFDERVMRMGYGAIDAVKYLTDSGIVVHSAPGLRIALVVVDEQGFIFTPTALYLEAEPRGGAPNAMRLSRQLAAETLGRLSPAAKTIAQAQAVTPEERSRIVALPVEMRMAPISEAQFERVDDSLKEAPPVKFDVARQVRVFEPYLQYVDLKLTGAAIQRHRVAIPPSIQKLGGSKEIEDRLHTTFDLIKKSGKLSSKKLEDELDKIRGDLAPSLGKDHGRVVLKAKKPLLEKLLAAFRDKLEAHKKAVEADLQQHLDDSRKLIIDYYLPLVIKAAPHALLGRILHDAPDENDARKNGSMRNWIASFPPLRSLSKACCWKCNSRM